MIANPGWPQRDDIMPAAVAGDLSIQREQRTEHDDDSDLPAVVRATASEARDLSWLIGRSFQDLDPSVALVEEEKFRTTVLSGHFETIVEHAMNYGHVYVLQDRSAVAVWFDHTTPVPEPEDYDRRRAAAGGQWTENLVQLDALQKRHHPEYPHHYLAFLAVADTVQHTGRGSKMLAHHHAVLDAAGIPAYLEAASWHLTRFYLKHSYRRGEPFHLPDNGPAFWPMLRWPRRSGNCEG